MVCLFQNKYSNYSYTFLVFEGIFGNMFDLNLKKYKENKVTSQLVTESIIAVLKLLLLSGVIKIELANSVFISSYWIAYEILE